MTPSNPTNNQPLIYRIADALGVFHLVAPVNHSHTFAEVPGLADEFSELWAGLNEKADTDDVVEALSGKMDNKTIDSTPTAGSTNLVTSGGVKAALDGKADTVHTHVASQVEGVMPYYVTYDGNSINLDAILTDPHTMQRLIIENADGSPLEIAAGLFTSPTEHLVIHINNTADQFIVEPGDYALVTIFKVDRGQTAHGHDVCYFAYVEGIFNYES